MEEVELEREHCPLGGNRDCCCLQRGQDQEALVGRAPQGLLEGGRPVELRMVLGEGSQDPH